MHLVQGLQRRETKIRRLLIFKPRLLKDKGGRHAEAEKKEGKGQKHGYEVGQRPGALQDSGAETVRLLIQKGDQVEKERRRDKKRPGRLQPEFS